MSEFPTTLDGLNRLGAGMLPGVLGIEFTSATPGLVEARLTLDQRHLAPNGYLHAATLVAIADTACGYGCLASLPDGGDGFTTIELKTNFLGTLTEGSIACRASLVHGGRTTQIWDAIVTDEATDRTLALFRCTQLVLRHDTARRDTTRPPA
jgi:1,4-dihydroxy-2-naphthoyl-CoA hydrolase